MHTSNTEQNTEMTDQSLREKPEYILGQDLEMTDQSLREKPEYILGQDLDERLTDILHSYLHQYVSDNMGFTFMIADILKAVEMYGWTPPIEPETKKRKCSDVHPDLERDHGGH